MPDRDRRANQPERVRERIESSRAEIIEVLLSLQDRLTPRTDWRGTIRRSPTTSLLGAFTVGYFLARLSSRQKD